MAKPSKKKSYTEDVVLNKILQDIANENLEPSEVSTTSSAGTNSYEDDLIKQYREEDIRQSRQKKLKIVMIFAVLLLMFTLIFIVTDTKEDVKKQPPAAKTITPTPDPITKPKEEKIAIPVEVKPVKKEPKPEPKKLIPAPVETLPKKEPVKSVKTQREIAKELLLQQMKN